MSNVMDSPVVTPIELSLAERVATSPRVVAVCRSSGGIPKTPVESAAIDVNGIVGDDHAHAKHIRPDRAISIFDLESLMDLKREGFPLAPGVAGENLTVENLRVQSLAPARAWPLVTSCFAWNSRENRATFWTPLIHD